MLNLSKKLIWGPLEANYFNEAFEDTKVVIRNRKSKDRQYNGKKKRDK